MLASWGATCGACKPRFAAPKTVILASSDVAGMLSLTLGWLVVVRSPDRSKQGTLIELIDPVVVLTRAGVPTPSRGAREIAIEDEYMSAGHATIRRPQGLSRDAAFTAQDRRHPGPSANGTFINGQRLAPDEVAPLGDGDIVRMGRTELYFKSLWLPATTKGG
jgi:hypothetical protein